MLRKAVLEGNGPVHQEEEFGSGQPAPVDQFQRLEEIWDRRIDVCCETFFSRDCKIT